MRRYDFLLDESWVAGVPAVTHLLFVATFV
jgi:hypothetical protein